MSSTKPDTANNTTPTEKRDIVVIIGKTYSSGSGYVYVEIDRPVAKTGAFMLNRYVYEEDPDFAQVFPPAKEVVKALLDSEETIGIDSVRVGLNFISPEIMEHFTHLLDKYMGIMLEAISRSYGLPLDVYIITKKLSERDLSALIRAIPVGSTQSIARDTQDVKDQLFKKTHPHL